MAGQRDFARGVTLLGGGPVADADLSESLEIAPHVVAADGGANVAHAAGMRPELVIGDMDSITPEVRAALDPATLWEVEEQHSTDFEKCLDRIRAPLILGLGFTGARIDHLMGVLSVLARRRGPHVLLGGHDVIFHAPAALSMDLAQGTRVSLFPMAAITGRSRGLEWPIDGLELSPAGRVGTSNRAEGPVALQFDAPGMVVMLPRDCLHHAIAAVTA